ncbi:MAG: hypothetical protein ACE5F7_05725 [Nitrospiria bacterium]
MKPLFFIKCLASRFLLAVVVFFFVLSPLPPANAADPTAAEIEQFVRARIDMGENMGNFFRNRRPPQFGPDGGPSMEELRKLEAEINAFISKILSKYDLTIEQYQSRSPDVFADQAGVNQFLDANPDLKKRYEALPQSPMRRRGPH